MIADPETIPELDQIKESLRKAPVNLRKLAEAIRSGELGTRNPVVSDEWVKELMKYAVSIEKILAVPTAQFGRRIKG